MAAACVDPEIALFCMMPAGYTVALARDFIADASRAWSDDGWLHLALTVAGDDRPVGAVGALAAEAARHGRARLLGDARATAGAAWGAPASRCSPTGPSRRCGLRRLVIGTMVTNTPRGA